MIQDYVVYPKCTLAIGGQYCILEDRGCWKIVTDPAGNAHDFVGKDMQYIYQEMRRRLARGQAQHTKVSMPA